MRSHSMTILVSVLFLTVVAAVVSADNQCVIQSADVVLIVDSSGSVGLAGWTKSLTFLTGLVEGFDVGYDKVRVGMMVLSKESKIAFKLNMYSRQSDVIDAIRVQKYPGSTTYTHIPLYEARDALYQPRNGMRPFTPNIVIIITDGKSQDPDRTKKAAQKLHAEMIFVIGVGYKVWGQELNDIASDVSYVYKITDYSSLATEQTRLKQKLCKEFAALYPTSSKTTTKMQPKTTTTSTMTATTTTTASTTKISQIPVPGDCYDRSPGCGKAKRLHCDDRPFLRKKCAKTCGFCKPLDKVKAGTPGLDYTCPAIIRDIVSPDSGLADVKLIVAGITHRMKLPVGDYEYRIGGGDNTCNITVIIQDHRLIRRLDIKSKYSIKCSLLTDNIALPTLRTLANSNVNQIREICKQDCGPQTGSEALLSCENDTLTVIWPTDVTYNGAVTRIPAGLKKRLTDRLAKQSRYPILDLLVLTKIPPLVYPTKTNTGAYAELTLTSSCLQNMIYDQTTDSCI